MILLSSIFFVLYNCGMEVYIEYVIIDNLIVDFLLLWSTLKIMKIKINKYLLVFSSLFGTIVSCILPLCDIDGVLLIFVKFLVGILMLLISHKPTGFVNFIYTFFVFLSLTFLMGGACYAVIILLGGTFENISIGAYDTIVPVSIVIATCFVYAFVIFRLTKYIYRKKDMIPFVGEAEIEIAGKNYKFKTFMDSGNRLYDKKTGAPVIILSAFALEKHIGSDDMVKLVFCEKNQTFRDVHYLEYQTVEGKTKKMVVFRPEKIVVHTNDKTLERNDICVGVTFKRFKDAINFDCLLHPSLV